MLAGPRGIQPLSHFASNLLERNHLDIMESQPLCRICRGEHSDAEPLVHPCKCKGSIKYIHQHCLMEWLKHSNKSVKQCDICNTPYKFRTIYDPDMPERIPLPLIFVRASRGICMLALKIFSICLYFVCIIIQVPIFWKFIGRMYTWAIDGQLPPANPTFVDALLFGENELEGLGWHKLRKFGEHTYFSGVRYILVYVIVHLALFVEHEWVIRDEGYTRMLLRHLGKEPKSTLADMLQNTINDLRQDAVNGNADAGAVVEQIDMLAHTVNDLHAPRIQLERDRVWVELEENIAHFRNNQGDEDHNRPEIDVDARDTHEPVDLRVLERVELANEQNEDPEPNEPQEQQQQQPQNQLDEHESDSEPDIDAQNEFDRLVDEALGVADPEVEDNNIFVMLGLNLNLSTPIFVMIMCDALIAIYLFITFLVPHTLGGAILGFVGVITRNLMVVLSNKIPDISVSKYVEELKSYTKSFEPVLYILYDCGYVPAKQTLLNLLGSSIHQPSTAERLIALLTGYSFVGFVIYQIMNSLTRGTKPLVGMPRRIYSVLFQCTSTIKVFFIFAIEIFFFPVYCGWLLDFCIAPILLENFTTNNGYVMLFTSISSYFAVDYIRVALYWAFGTLYMLSFALFVGMTRSKILRPGVLFFIRSPDDPNARLIHDALVKPLRLQLSRICLSAEVYTGFIVIGIGGVTWGIRYLLNPNLFSSENNVILPIKWEGSYDLPFVVGSGLFLLSNKNLISKYVEMYWKKAFELSCHKMRLSHFILDKPISQERGYVIYRNPWEQFKGTSPDFSRPVTYREAQELFRTTDTPCFFVPDGSYIRVPSNDTVSRKYIKRLFVAVSKDDILLENVEPPVDNEDDSEDEGYTNDNNYVVVYKPPHLKWRCFQLILMLWVFAVLLIVTVGFIALMLGRLLRIDRFILPQIQSSGLTTVERTVAQHNWKLADMKSACLGLVFELLMLAFFHNQNHQNEIENVRMFNIFENEEVFRFNAFGANFTTPQRFALAGLAFLSLLFGTFWLILTHLFAVDVPYKVYKNFDLMPYTELILTKETVVAHLLIAIWTVQPLVLLFISREFRDMEQFDLKEAIAKTKVLSNGAKVLGVHLPCTVYVLYRVYTQKYQLTDLYCFPLAVLVYIMVDTYFKLVLLFRNYDQQIRNEKYVRGRALENID